jgi:formamidopyrimidine-DNA glycosylase
MPERDSIYRAAQAMHRALAGKTITRFESVYPALTRIAEDHPIVGRTVESVSARGKHLLAGIHPFTQVSAIPDEALGRIVDIARNELKANVLSRSQTLNVSTGRTTTRSLDPNRKLWVYGRGGKRCLNCGTSVESRKPASTLALPTGVHAVKRRQGTGGLGD